MSDVEMELLCDDENLIDVNEDGKLQSSEEEGEISDSDGDEKMAWKSQSEKKEDPKEKFKENIANLFSQEDGDQLYTSLGVDECRHTRFDTIHMYGTKDMETTDVFLYFQDHKPLFLEWVSETSCNVVWPDNVSAAQAMMQHSSEMEDISGLPPGKWRKGKPYPKAEQIYMRFATKSDKNVTGKDKIKMLSKKYKSLDSGLISKSLKGQIVTADIDCEKTKNPWGELCETWGVNDTQEIFGVPSQNYSQSHNHRSVKDRIGRPLVSEEPTSPIRSRKRMDLKMRLGKRVIPTETWSEPSESEEDLEDDSDEEWRSRSKIPRMRMHADDEEKKHGKARLKSRLDEDPRLDLDNITVEIKNESTATSKKPTQKSNKDDLRNKLKQRRKEEDEYSSESDDDGQVVSTVWARLERTKDRYDSDDDEDDELRNVISKACPKVAHSRPGFNQSDLRSRLGKRANASPLRIEVDNEHYSPK